MKIKHLLILLILMISCKGQELKKSFLLNGTIKGDVPSYFYLEYGKVKDCIVVKGNKFKLKGYVNKPKEAYFSISPISTFTKDWFSLENKEINIEITVEKKILKGYEINFIKIDTINGTKTALIRNDFERFEYWHKDDLDWNLKLFQKIEEIIINNPSKSYSAYVLVQNIKNLNKNQITTLYKKIDTSALSNKYREVIRMVVYPNQILDVGKQLTDFNLPNLKNKIISTKNFRGKILLIDFWASWCVPCRKVNPELLKVYKRFKEHDFEILGVSLDTKVKNWEMAIIKDKLIWENTIDIEAFSGEIATRYNVTSIPTNFLINKNGKIIAKNITISDLKIQLNKILNTNN